LNIQFLDHDTLTDVISFDNSLGIQIHGEIYISIERVRENARAFSESFNEELHRVMIHGILHFCGYKDKTTEEERLMRDKENNALELLGKR
ncbi:MAG: putative rRNA maturation factor, partial [Patiriisocius sp.]